HVVTGNTPAIRLEQDGSSGFTAQTWDIAGNVTNFFVRDVTGGSTLPFRIEPGTASNTLYLDSAERVGVGTTAPTDMLHVRSTTGVASALVEEASVTAAQRTLMTVRNNGQTRFVIHNTAAAVPVAGGYFFAQFDNGRFVIRPSGGGVGFFMDENGNITAEGDLTVNGTFSNPSSRTLKENFRPLDPQQVLARFVEVPITEWSYKGDEMRHVGPVTEDFHAAFGLGTKGTGIIPLDVQGVTMAAVQGLYQRLVALEAQRADLEAEVTELKALLAKTAE
ncbi:MAG: tail fiber domain-containing protein, partial [Candidatus Rokuibacteriota bacterium]